MRVGASSGDLLVHDEASVEAVIKAIKRRAAFRPEDEYRLGERRPLARTGTWTPAP